MESVYKTNGSYCQKVKSTNRRGEKGGPDCWCLRTSVCLWQYRSIHVDGNPTPPEFMVLFLAILSSFEHTADEAIFVYSFLSRTQSQTPPPLPFPHPYPHTTVKMLAIKRPLKNIMYR